MEAISRRNLQEKRQHCSTSYCTESTDEKATNRTGFDASLLLEFGTTNCIGIGWGSLEPATGSAAPGLAARRDKARRPRPPCRHASRWKGCSSSPLERSIPRVTASAAAVVCIRIRSPARQPPLPRTSTRTAMPPPFEGKLVTTFGPLGPFLHKGVEVVSQLAHLRARRSGSPAMFEPMVFPPPEAMLPPVPMDVCFLGWDRLSQRKLDMHEGGWICAVGDGKVLCSVRRVDGVPRDKVQSTDEEASDLLPSKASLSVNLLPDAGKKMENEAAPPPQSNPHEHCCVLLWWPHWCNMVVVLIEKLQQRGSKS
ncbi:hypothetical protein BHE74_00018056 [Ensete ventricosum]|nr:hypothetical protein BHE74_00018056 [Ensete ventricosum]